jgi:hypothetical protein
MDDCTSRQQRQYVHGTCERPSVLRASISRCSTIEQTHQQYWYDCAVHSRQQVLRRTPHVTCVLMYITRQHSHATARRHTQHCTAELQHVWFASPQHTPYINNESFNRYAAHLRYVCSGTAVLLNDRYFLAVFPLAQQGGSFSGGPHHTAPLVLVYNDLMSSTRTGAHNLLGACIGRGWPVPATTIGHAMGQPPAQDHRALPCAAPHYVQPAMQPTTKRACGQKAWVPCRQAGSVASSGTGWYRRVQRWLQYAMAHDPLQL